MKKILILLAGVIFSLQICAQAQAAGTDAVIQKIEEHISVGRTTQKLGEKGFSSVQSLYKKLQGTGKENEPYTLALMNYARGLYETGKGSSKNHESYESAIEFYRNSITFLNEMPERSEGMYAFVLMSMAESFYGLKQREKALECYSEACSIYETYLEADSLPLIKAYSNLALSATVKDNDTAVFYKKKQLEIEERIFGPGSLDAADSLAFIGKYSSRNHGHDEAIEYLEAALSIKERILGRHHPKTAELYRSIAFEYYLKGTLPGKTEERKALTQEQLIQYEKDSQTSLGYYKTAYSVLSYDAIKDASKGIQALTENTEKSQVLSGIITFCRKNRDWTDLALYNKKYLELTGAYSKNLYAGYAVHNREIADCYEKTGRPLLALSYCERAMEIYNQITLKSYEESQKKSTEKKLASLQKSCLSLSPLSILELDSDKSAVDECQEQFVTVIHSGKKIRLENFAGNEGKTELSPYEIGRFEVTRELYQEVTGSLPPYQSPCAQGEDEKKFPVENVTWYDAVYFCNALTKKTMGADECYYIIEDIEKSEMGSITKAKVRWDFDKKGFRLPTEEEWEYAARGGNKGGWSDYYSGSNEARDVAWFSQKQIHQTGLKKPNALGLYDMSGNAAEWTNSRFVYDDLQDKIEQVLRGGIFFEPKEKCTVSHRRGYEPGEEIYFSFGFRLARSIF